MTDNSTTNGKNDISLIVLDMFSLVLIWITFL